MEFTTIEGGNPDKRRAALDALPPEIRDAFDRQTVLQGLAEGDPIFDLALLIAKTTEKLKGPDPKKLSELLFNHAAQLERAKSSIAQTLEALNKHEATLDSRADELAELAAGVKAAMEKDREERRKTSDLLDMRTESLVKAFDRLTRAQKRLSWGHFALSAAVGFVFYPFADRLLRLFGL